MRGEGLGQLKYTVMHGWGGEWSTFRVTDHIPISLQTYAGPQEVAPCPTDVIALLWYRQV